MSDPENESRLMTSHTHGPHGAPPGITTKLYLFSCMRVLTDQLNTVESPSQEPSGTADNDSADTKAPDQTPECTRCSDMANAFCVECLQHWCRECVDYLPSYADGDVVVAIERDECPQCSLYEDYLYDDESDCTR